MPDASVDRHPVSLGGALPVGGHVGRFADVVGTVVELLEVGHQSARHELDLDLLAVGLLDLPENRLRPPRPGTQRVRELREGGRRHQRPTPSA